MYVLCIMEKKKKNHYEKKMKVGTSKNLNMFRIKKKCV